MEKRYVNDIYGTCISANQYQKITQSCRQLYNEFVIISCMHANTEEKAGKKMAIFRILRGAYRVLLTTERVEQA